MELKQLQYFRAAAKENSISHAAQALYITQPALSRCIKRLEAEVGTPLMERMTSGVKLTPAGEAFLKELDQAFLHLEQGLRDARTTANADKPTLSIVCSFEDFDDKVLERLHQDFPDVQISFDILPPDQAYRELLAGKASFAVIPAHKPRPELICEALLQEEMLISTPPGHPFHGREDISIRELDGCACVCNEVAYSWDAISDACRRHQLGLKLLFSGTDHQTIGRFKGLMGGLLFVPISATMDRAPDDRRVMTFPSRVAPQIFFRDICLAYREDRQLSTAEKHFIELVRGYYRKRRQEIINYTRSIYGETQ